MTIQDKTKKILAARVNRGGKWEMGRVEVLLENEEEYVLLFEYYSDEISFFSGEFIGLTVEEAWDLYRRKDIAYIQS